MTTILGQGVGQKDANIGQKKAVKNFVVQFYFFVRKIWPIQIIVEERQKALLHCHLSKQRRMKARFAQCCICLA